MRKVKIRVSSFIYKHKQKVSNLGFKDCHEKIRQTGENGAIDMYHHDRAISINVIIPNFWQVEMEMLIYNRMNGSSQKLPLSSKNKYECRMN
ncbi:hypothetical protein CHCC20375_2783 [Bacillus licheniformis]|nr:hypothetical protein CHCC20375_2783 [Bacillus licheniformis]